MFGRGIVLPSPGTQLASDCMSPPSAPSPLVGLCARSTRRRATASGPVASEEARAVWRLYAALDKCDEASHVALSRFVDSLAGLNERAHEDLGTQLDGDENSHRLQMVGTGRTKYHASTSSAPVCNVQVYGLSRSVRLPCDITRPVAMEIVSRFMQGEVLDADDLAILLQKTRALLLQEELVNRTVSPESIDGRPGGVVVVGDLHGSMPDLAMALSICGEPGHTTYIFNGDFVDRGRHGVEVLASLCALKLANPKSVFLNRGNHECRGISHTYGLRKEVKSKYRGPMAFKLYDDMCALFSALPLATVIGGAPGDRVSAFVVHGGIPSDTSVDLKSIGSNTWLDRTAPLNQKVCRSDQEVAENAAAEHWNLLEDLLWSDPVTCDLDSTIRQNSTRKAGCFFGLGAVRNFLKRDGLTTLVRSHEVQRFGAERHDCGEGTEMYTVFSCSNYPDQRGSNVAAALRFPVSNVEASGDRSFQYGGHSGAEVVTWGTGPGQVPAVGLECQRAVKFTVQSLVGLITRQRHAILDACRMIEDEEAKDAGRTHKVGLISHAGWNRAMSSWGASIGLMLPFADWKTLLSVLQRNEVSFQQGETEEETVNYVRLLEGFANSSLTRDRNEDKNHGLSEDDIMHMYCHKKELASIFSWIDADGDHSLCPDELARAVRVLNAQGGEPIDPGALFRVMDIDNSGRLDTNEFMECFRLARKLQD